MWLPPSVELAAGAEEWESQEEKNNKLSRVDWFRNVAYYETDKTKVAGTGRGFQGWDTWNTLIQEAQCLLEEFPLSTTAVTLTKWNLGPPERILDSTACDRNAAVLENVWGLLRQVWMAHEATSASPEDPASVPVALTRPGETKAEPSGTSETSETSDSSEPSNTTSWDETLVNMAKSSLEPFSKWDLEFTVQVHAVLCTGAQNGYATWD